MRLVHYLIIIACLLCFSTLLSCGGGFSVQSGNTHPEEDEIVLVEEEYEDDCDDCDGSGYVTLRCLSCGGTGASHRYTSGTKPKDCYRCVGTGLVRCETCGGRGYTLCEYCNGQGSYKCSVCHGYGIIIVDPSQPHRAPKCGNCNGTGYVKCLNCRGARKIHCCNNGLATCPVCWGSGTYGSESYSYTETIDCSGCNGNGTYRSRCYECNGTGRVKKIRTVEKRKSEL